MHPLSRLRRQLTLRESDSLRFVRRLAPSNRVRCHPGGGAKKLAAPFGGSPAKRARGCIGWRSHLFSFYGEAEIYKET